MPAPLYSLSPLTIAALLASLAAHGSVAMYVVNHEVPAPSAAAEVATSIEVETVAAADPVQPDIAPDVVPPPSPPALPTSAPPKEPQRVQSATLRPTPSESAPPSPADATAVMTAAAGDDSPHFAMVIGTAVTAPGGLTRAGGGAAPAPPVDGPLPSDGVDQLARLVTGPAPVYPTAARDDGIEADVPLDIVVDESGRVIDVRATRHIGSGLDESAAAAIRGYRFSPAMRGGRAVKVRMRWTVVFRLG